MYNRPQPSVIPNNIRFNIPTSQPLPQSQSSHEAYSAIYMQPKQNTQPPTQTQLLADLMPTPIQTIANNPSAPTVSVVPVKTDFNKLYPQLSWRDPDLLHEKFMNDARNIPRIDYLRLRVNDIYNQRFINNLNNIYANAPSFFASNFFYKRTNASHMAQINNVNFEAYQLYIYLLCYIQYVDTNSENPALLQLPNIDITLAWVSTRRDPSIDFIIEGPTVNSNLINNDFQSHYQSLISPATDMSQMTAYNQLATQQTLSKDLFTLLNFLRTAPNVDAKTADTAKKYTINIDSSRDVMVHIDSDNNLIYDMNRVNLGDVLEQSKIDKYNDLQNLTETEPRPAPSALTMKKLQTLFNKYSRISVAKCLITPDSYITSLDAFAKVYIIFKGVICGERTVYNTVNTTYLKIGGTFKRTKHGYEFEQDTDAITFKGALANVKSFEVYITTDPSKPNTIIPNNFAIKLTKNDIYQHPIAVNTNKPFNDTVTLNVRQEVEHSYVDTVDSTSNKTPSMFDYDEDLNKDIIVHTRNSIHNANSLPLLIQSLKQFSEQTTHDMTSPTYLFVESLISLLTSGNIPLTTVEELLTKNEFLRHVSIPVWENIILAKPNVQEMINKVSTVLSSDIIDIDTTSIPFGSDTFTLERLTSELSTILNNIIKNIPSYSSMNKDQNDIAAYQFFCEQLFFSIINTQYDSLIPSLSMHSSSTVFLNTFSFYVNLKGVLYSILKQKGTAAALRIEKKFEWSTVNVNTPLGTINGKFFRVNGQRNVIFTDEDGKPFSTPDERYLRYTQSENDLMLYNLYKSTPRSILNNISQGSFFFSNRLRVIQNLPYILSTHDGTDNAFRFDNSYTYVMTKDGRTMHLSATELINQLNTTTPYRYYKKRIVSYSLERDADGAIISRTELPAMYEYIGVNLSNNVIETSTNSESNLGATIEAYLPDSRKEDSLITQIDSTTQIDTYYYVTSIGVTRIDSFYNYYDKKSYYQYETDVMIIKLDVDDSVSGSGSDGIVGSPSPGSGSNVNANNGLNTSPNNGSHSNTVTGNTSSTIKPRAALSPEQPQQTVLLKNITSGTFDINLTPEQESFNPFDEDVSLTDTSFELIVRDADTPITISGVFSLNKSTDKRKISENLSLNNTNHIFVVNGYISHTSDSSIIPVPALFGGIIWDFDYNITKQKYSSHNIRLKIQDTLSVNNITQYHITDQFGNLIDINMTDNTQTFTNSLFNIIDDIIGVSYTQSGKNTTGNNLYTTYTFNPALKQILIENYILNSIAFVENHYNISIDALTSDLIIHEYTKDINTLVLESENVIPVLYNDHTSNAVYINTTILSKFMTYASDINTEYSNAYKAFSINYDIVTKYWTKTAMVQSLMLADMNPSTQQNFIPAVIPRENINSPYQIDLSTSANRGLVLYNYENGVFNQYEGNYLINKNGIMVNTGGVIKPSGLTSLYAYEASNNVYSTNRETVLYYYSESRAINTTTVLSDINLYDTNLNVCYRINVEICCDEHDDITNAVSQNAKIKKINVFEKLRGISQDTNGQYIINENNFVYVGSYEDGFLTNTPIYIDDLEIVLEFVHTANITEKYFTIDSVSITRTKYSCVEYSYDRPTKLNKYTTTIRQRNVDVMKYSNIPGSYLVNSGPLTDVYMGMRLCRGVYKYHPRVEYVEKSFVSPVYHTNTNDYITLVKKSNYNVVTSNVLLRNNYDNSDMGAANNIAKSVLCDKEHILESVNKDYMLLGNVNKLGTLSDMAIVSDEVYIVPMSARMYLSLEFT